jgi:hypothetical protein
MTPRSVDAELAAALRLDDPAQRLKRLDDVVLPALKDVHEQAHAARALAALELNESGVGYRRIAALCGKTLPWAQQVVGQGRRLRDGKPRRVSAPE